jgi:lipopolysaccharide transport system ATP-binding protein
MSDPSLTDGSRSGVFMAPAIKIENLSKRYRIGSKAGRGYQTLRESIMAGASAPFKRLAQLTGWDGRDTRPDGASGAAGEFWALRDVSFDVQQGDVVGIIGRNGAGKSTLLKILSRITDPTSGRAELRGRIGSLLEVGTGFHQELTGRENIYLNGSILGMSRHEIARRFDEIVAFSEIDEFLDTPVKRYSSGMYVRLAFAVAAHLEPEILVVDEVLAVGDHAFQKRCLGKMNEVGKSGRTVLFVSHNMTAVKALCRTGVLLRSGCVQEVGPVSSVVDCYMREGLDPDHGSFNRNRRLALSRECEILDAWLSAYGAPTEEVEWLKPFQVHLKIKVHDRITLSPEFLVRDCEQQPVLFAPTGLYQGFKATLDAGVYQITSSFPGQPFAAGTYYIDLMLAESNVRFYDYYECGLRFDVENLPRLPEGWRFSQSRRQGSLPLAVETSIARDD